MAFFNFKNKKVPNSNETKDVLVYEKWEVRWQSRYGEYSNSVKPEVEVFLSEEDAKDFVKALKNAFALIKHTDGNTVTLEKAK